MFMFPKQLSLKSKTPQTSLAASAFFTPGQKTIKGKTDRVTGYVVIHYIHQGKAEAEEASPGRVLCLTLGWLAETKAEGFQFLSLSLRLTKKVTRI